MKEAGLSRKRFTIEKVTEVLREPEVALPQGKRHEAFGAAWEHHSKAPVAGAGSMAD